MRTRHTAKPKRGFTLIEILIVVVILGILAAIVIPQFAESAEDANRSSARSQLQTVRAQFELCKFRGFAGCDCAANDITVVIDALVDNSLLQAEPSMPQGFGLAMDNSGTCARIVATGPVSPTGDDPADW